MINLKKRERKKDFASAHRDEESLSVEHAPLVFVCSSRPLLLAASLPPLEHQIPCSETATPRVSPPPPPFSPARQVLVVGRSPVSRSRCPCSPSLSGPGSSVAAETEIKSEISPVRSCATKHKPYTNNVEI